MRELFVVLIITSLLPACFRRPYVGLLTFSWLAYMRVQDLAWGTVRNMRWSYYVAILTFAGFVMNSKRERWFMPTLRSWIMILMIALVALGVGFSMTGAGDKFQISRLMEFIKIVVIALFTTAVITTREHLRVMMWVIALSFAFYGVKSGLWGVMTMGRSSITTGPGGMLADNNDFALALAMSVPLCFHIGMSEKKEILRKVFFVSIPLIMITVLLTGSRGGFLSLVGGIGVLIWRSRNRGLGIGIGVLLGILGLILAPSNVKDRLGTLQNVEEDSSAKARFRSWAAGTRMALDNPVLGVGLNKFRSRYMDYQPNPTAQELRGDNIFVAHNSYIQIWAETGSISFFLYAVLIAMSFRSCWRIRKLASRKYYSSWMINYAVMFEASLTSFCIGSTFLNRGHFDLLYHYVALIMVFEKLALQDLNDRNLVPTQNAGQQRQLGGDGLRRVRPHGFGRGPVVQRGFRDTPAPQA